ncbi:MAG TPA: hypothetical protein VFV38_09390 [Ktedonobacteraceae bacterium]|nr:hypothetical protein [Ktedonobacteraceae bacterium]
MRKFCKGYYLRDLRQFHGWTEKGEADEAELSDDVVVYLWDDFTVVRSPVIPDKGLVFDAVTPEWKEFCTTTLGFAIPEDLQYAYEPAAQGAEGASTAIREG